MSDWRPEAVDFLRQNEDRFVRQATRCCWLHKVPHLAEDVLRDAIEKLLENWPNKGLAGVRSPRLGRKPATWTRVNRDYETLRIDMQTLYPSFYDLGITTGAAAA